MRWLILLLMALPVSAATFGTEIQALGVDSFLYVTLFSLGGGVVSSLRKITGSGITNVPLEICKDLSTSALAGLIAFFTCESIHTPPMAEAAAITLSGYGGAVVLDKFLGRYLNKLEDVK